jgi:hypothetical protein
MRILVVLIISVLFYYLQSYIYSTKCFDNIFVALSFTLTGIFEGEGTQLVEEFSNKKLIPLWWVTLRYRVSRRLVFLEEENNNGGNDNYRKDFFSIMSYEKITKTLNVIGGKRGYYTIDHLNLRSGDLFGLNEILLSLDNKASLYVYPRLINPQELAVTFKSLTGEILTKRNLVEDPFQLRGIREYHPFDSMKAINWSATAKTGEFKVNQYDFTASQEVVIFLNVEKHNQWDSEKLIEVGISLAASLITQYLKRGMKVGLRTNGCDIITGGEINLSSICGANQNLYFYQSLARLDTARVSSHLSQLLKVEQIKGNKTPLWVVISHYFGDDLKGIVSLSRLQGYEVKWILPKEAATKADIGDKRDLYVWDVMET